MSPLQPPAGVHAAIPQFEIEGTCLGIEPLVRGHINQSFVSTFGHAGHEARYLHQRINGHVFGDVEGLMHNVELVTRRLGEALAEVDEDPGYEALRLVPTRAGATWLDDPGGPWRSYHFVEDTEAHDRCRGPEQAFEVARIFGWFQHALAGLDADALVETIPGFFSPGLRLAQLEAALAAPPSEQLAGRRERAREALGFIFERRALFELFEGHLRSGRFPRRILHGDTKLNNVLFDTRTQRARAVVDLDTTMPGFVLYDFGDMVRFCAATSAEDEPDLTLAGTDPELAGALREGYLECAADMLSPLERELLPLAGPLVTLVIGARFLTDYLLGDTYFATTREHHNLDRARVQLAQVASMERA